MTKREKRYRIKAIHEFHMKKRAQNVVEVAVRNGETTWEAFYFRTRHELEERMRSVFAEIREWILDQLPPPYADVDTEKVYFFVDPDATERLRRTFNVPKMAHNRNGRQDDMEMPVLRRKLYPTE